MFILTKKFLKEFPRTIALLFVQGLVLGVEKYLKMSDNEWQKRGEKINKSTTFKRHRGSEDTQKKVLLKCLPQKKFSRCRYGTAVEGSEKNCVRLLRMIQGHV